MLLLWMNSSRLKQTFVKQMAKFRFREQISGKKIFFSFTIGVGCYWRSKNVKKHLLCVFNLCVQLVCLTDKSKQELLNLESFGHLSNLSFNRSLCFKPVFSGKFLNKELRTVLLFGLVNLSVFNFFGLWPNLFLENLFGLSKFNFFFLLFLL